EIAAFVRGPEYLTTLADEITTTGNHGDERKSRIDVVAASKRDETVCGVGDFTNSRHQPYTIKGGLQLIDSRRVARNCLLSRNQAITIVVRKVPEPTHEPGRPLSFGRRPH